MTEAGAELRRRPGRGAEPRLRRARPDRRRRGLRRRRQGGHHRLDRLRRQGRRRRRLPRGHRRHHRRRHRLRRPAGLRRQAARHRRARRRRRRRRGRRAGAPGDGARPATRWPRCATASTPCSSRARPSATLMFYGRGAGGSPTASAVLGDLIDAAAQPAPRARHASVGALAKARLRPIDEVEPSTTSTSTWSTARACSPRWPACSATTACRSARWSRRASAPRPASCSSPTWPGRPTCRPPSATCATSTSSTASASVLRVDRRADAGMKYVSTRGAAPESSTSPTCCSPGWPATAASTCPRRGRRCRRPRPRRDLRRRRRRGHVALRRGIVDTGTTLDALVRRRLRHLRPPGRRALRRARAPALWLLELFHGPTLAFKDVALQLVGRLFDHELARRGERVTIVGATSRRHRLGRHRRPASGARAVDIVMLHPAGRVSRRAAPADDHGRRPQRPQRRRRGHLRRLPGPGEGAVRRRRLPRPRRPVGRELDQLGAGRWPRSSTTSRPAGTWRAGPPARATFAVPTGNFGNVFAGWVARRDGAPIDRLIIGSNSNDILTRWSSRPATMARPA